MAELQNITNDVTSSLAMPIVHEIHYVCMSGKIVCVAPIIRVVGRSSFFGVLVQQLLFHEAGDSGSDPTHRDAGVLGEAVDGETTMFAEGSKDLLEGC